MSSPKNGYTFVGKDLGDLIDDLERKGLAVNRVKGKALKLAAQPILHDDKYNAPEATGAGVSSIKVGRVENKKGGSAITIGIDRGVMKPVFYMKFQEWGTHNADGSERIEAKRFTYNAIQKNKDKASKIIINELRRALRT